jgi:Flp pilus assembly secretin CpaC
MKIWYGYGSEHSMNLVMIGRFREAADAASAGQIIEWFMEQVQADVQEGLVKVGEHTGKFTERMFDLFRRTNVASISPAEFEQFVYDVQVKVEDKQVIVTTEEIDISAFLKVLLLKGARVEVFSAHDFPGAGRGRGN